MQQYLGLLRTVLEEGVKKEDRTGTGTLSKFGCQLRFDLAEGFPLLTTKKLHTRSIIHELLWFLKGDTNISYLQENGVRIWDEWADTDGELGPIYGHQWRNWGTSVMSKQNGFRGIDQIQQAIDTIKNDPNSRRIIVSAWNVSQLSKMALPPCHMMFQFYVRDGKLDCLMYQRSADLALGVPFNIASYALLTMIIAKECDLEPGDFIHAIGDCHIYLNHVEGIKLQFNRKLAPLPKLAIRLGSKFGSQTVEDFSLVGYDPQPFIKFEISV